MKTRIQRSAIVMAIAAIQQLMTAYVQASPETDCTRWANAKALEQKPSERPSVPYTDEWTPRRQDLLDTSASIVSCFKNGQRWRDCVDIPRARHAQWRRDIEAVKELSDRYYKDDVVPTRARQQCPRLELGRYDYVLTSTCSILFEAHACLDALSINAAVYAHLAIVETCLWDRVLDAKLDETRRQLAERFAATCEKERSDQQNDTARATTTDIRRDTQQDASAGSEPSDARNSQRSVDETSNHSSPSNQRHRSETSRSAAEERVRRHTIATAQAADMNRANAAALSSILGGSGGGNSARGVSWHAQIELGGGALIVPLYVNSSEPGYVATSSSSIGGGIGPRVMMRLWPIYGRYGGIGGYASGFAGIMSIPSGSTWAWFANAGATAFVGSDSSLAIEASLEQGWRGAGYSTEDPVTIGNGEYKYMRFGGGIRLCTSKDSDAPGYCKSSFRISGFRDVPRVDIGLRAWVGELSYWRRRNSVLSLEVSTSYPAAGTPSYRSDEDTALFVGVFFSKSYDYFGAPFFR